VLNVSELTPLAEVLAERALILHIDFLQNSSRRRIAPEVVRIDPIQTEDVERVVDRRTSCFSTVPLVPIGLSNPEPQFCATVRRRDMKANGANERIVGPQNDSEIDEFTLLKFLLMC